MLSRLTPLFLVTVAFGTPAPESPFHPYALQPLMPWMSDTRETVRVVRLASDAEFAEPVETGEVDGAPGVRWRSASRTDTESGGRESLNYAVLHEGTDQQVLEVGEWGGGSGVFGTVMVAAPESRRLLLADLSDPTKLAAAPAVVTVPTLRLISQFGTGDRTSVRLSPLRPGAFRIDITKSRDEATKTNSLELRLDGLRPNP